MSKTAKEAFHFFFANRIGELMKQKGFSLSYLASQIGISRNTLATIIENKNELIRPDIYKKIAEQLKVSYSDLFVYEHEQKKQNLINLTTDSEEILNQVASNNMDIRIAISFIEDCIEKIQHIQEQQLKTQQYLHQLQDNLEKKYHFIEEQLFLIGQKLLDKKKKMYENLEQ